MAPYRFPWPTRALALTCIPVAVVPSALSLYNISVAPGTMFLLSLPPGTFLCGSAFQGGLTSSP